MTARAALAAPAAVLVAALLPGAAHAAPTCPEQNAVAAYQTPVTITLACSDAVSPVVGYQAFSYPGFATVSLVGDRLTATPAPSVSNTLVVVNYRAQNAMGESTIGFVNLFVGPAPVVPPPPNAPPVARCDVYNAKTGEILRVDRRRGVLANDSDPDGDKLTASAPRSSLDDASPRPDLRPNGSLTFPAFDKPRLFSYRYEATDARGASVESTLTIGVGVKATACQAAFEPPAQSPDRYSFTLRRASGSVRIRGRGGWRGLAGKQKLTRPLLIDARRGGAKVRLLSENNYYRQVQTAHFSGGLLKLGRSGPKLPGRKRQASFNSFALAGDPGCRFGRGPGRRLKVAARPGISYEGLRLQVLSLYRGNRPVISRYTLTDGCDRSSTVSLQGGRVQFRDKNTGQKGVMRPGQHYNVRPRG